MVAGALWPGEERETEARLVGVAEALRESGHESIVAPIRVGAVGAPDAASLRGELSFLCPSGDPKQDVAMAAVLEASGALTIGARWLALALSHDALKVRELLRVYNVATAPYYRLEPMHPESVPTVHGSFGFPALVHPRGGGRGRRVSSLDELGHAMVQIGFDEAVVERSHAGDRVGVAVLRGKALGITDLRGQAVTSGLSSARRSGIFKLAERAAEALDGTGAVMVKLGLGLAERENECVLGVDLCPELSARSTFVRTARDAGHSFAEICDLLVREARASMGYGGASRRPPARQFQAPVAESAADGSAEAVAALAQTG